MPPVIAAVAAVITSITGALGIVLPVTGSLSGTTLPVLPDVQPEQASERDHLLDIEGQLLPFNEASNHLSVILADGREIVDASASMIFYAVGQDFLGALCGIPIFAADKRSRIGHVSRAWVEGNGVRIAGEVCDSLKVRYHISRQSCGLCLFFDYETPWHLQTGPLPPITPKRVLVTLPGQGGFESNWVRFVDSSTDVPGFVADLMQVSVW